MMASAPAEVPVDWSPSHRHGPETNSEPLSEPNQIRSPVAPGGTEDARREALTESTMAPRLAEEASRCRWFINAAELLSSAVSDGTVLSYADARPDLWARGPEVRRRVTALKLEGAIASAVPAAAHRLRL